MRTKIKEHLEKYYKSKGWGESPGEAELIEVLRDANTVWRGDEDEHRWWIEFMRVVEINGLFIGYIDARTTGDENAHEKGFEIDENTICEMVAITQTIPVTTYVPKPMDIEQCDVCVGKPDKWCPVCKTCLPELLEALKQLDHIAALISDDRHQNAVTPDSDWSELHSARMKARAAIAKAEPTPNTQTKG